MKTEITVDTHRILTIKRGGRCRSVWCEDCGDWARMVSADEAVILSGLTSLAIFRFIEARTLHFVETPDGLCLICINSLGKLS